MKITRVETLGDLVAYKPKEIQVLGAVYDKVPSEFMEDFETVVNSAKNLYDSKVAEAKANNEKPKSALYKKESIDSVIRPFLNRFGIEDKATHQRVIKSDNPRIPSDNEKITISKKSPIVDIDVDLDDMGDLFNNFDSDMLGDEVAVNVEIDNDELGAQSFNLGSETDGLFEDEDFDFEGLLN